MKRSESWRRHVDNKVINKRIKIFKSWFRNSEEFRNFYDKKRNKLNKWNFTCPCNMCRAYRDKYDRLSEKKDYSKEINNLENY